MQVVVYKRAIMISLHVSFAHWLCHEQPSSSITMKNAWVLEVIYIALHSTASTIFTFSRWNSARHVDHRWCKGIWQPLSNKAGYTNIRARKWVICYESVCIGKDPSGMLHDFIRFLTCNLSSAQTTILYASTISSLSKISDFLFKICLVYFSKSTYKLSAKHLSTTFQLTKWRFQ